MTQDLLPHGLTEAMDEIAVAGDLAFLIAECDHQGASAAATVIGEKLEAAKKMLNIAREALIEASEVKGKAA